MIYYGHMLRQHKYWHEPENFNPERFMKDGIYNISNDAFVPFGIGLRKCLGDKLAIVNLFCTFARFIQFSLKYTIDLHVDDDDFLLPKKDSFIENVPKKFKILMRVN